MASRTPTTWKLSTLPYSRHLPQFRGLPEEAPRREVSPGWLASLIAHLAILSIFTAFAEPNLKPPAPVTLVLDAASVSPEPPDTVTVGVMPSAPVTEQPEPLGGSDLPPATQQASVTSPNSAHRDVAQVEVEAAEPNPVQETPLVNDWQLEPQSELNPQLAMLLGRPMPVQVGIMQRNRPAQWPTFSEAHRYNEIVERFILYDIGQLRGEEGARARHDFMQLGGSAVPSMVRGLNQSASIHATCPVGVISAKLAHTLMKEKDRRLTQYVIDQIGKGVPSDAPHLPLLENLRRRLSRWAHQSEQQRRKRTSARTVPPTSDFESIP